MREFPGFTAADFDVFGLPGLEERMGGIIAGPRPKLEALGRDLAADLGALTGHPVYPIVARHARRKVNPPNDTWVAWSGNKRGYKMVPHFQVGLWQSHAFIQGGVIYEAHGRQEFARNLLANLEMVRETIPGHYRWLEDYTNPQGILHKDMTQADFERIADRLITRKEADCMVGLSVDRGQVIKEGSAFADTVLKVFSVLMPVYRLASVVVPV